MPEILMGSYRGSGTASPYESSYPSTVTVGFWVEKSAGDPVRLIGTAITPIRTIGKTTSPTETCPALRSLTGDSSSVAAIVTSSATPMTRSTPGPLNNW